MIAFSKRNILLYFRDKASVFFSLLAVIILIGLYVFFLSDVTYKGLPEFPSKKAVLHSWFLAGILTVTSMTTTLGAFGILVEDRANKRYMDFYASPISRAKLVGGYIVSALFVGFVMCLLTLVVANIFFTITGESQIALNNFFLLISAIILAVLSNGALVLFLVSFFKTSNAFAAASTVVGTLLGFLAGIYIPIGTLPEYLQTIVKFFPASHSASLFRQILMESSMLDAFKDAPIELKESFILGMGIRFDLDGEIMKSLWSVYYLIGTTILFFLLSLLIMNKKSV